MQINVIDDLIAIEKAVLPRKDDLTITRLILIGRTSTNLRKEILKTWKKYFEDSCVVYA